MKKFLFTCVFASFTLLASAQFMVGTSLDFNNDNNDDGFEMSNLTDNLFFGYQISDNFMLGLSMQDATADSIYIFLDGTTETIEDAAVVSEMQFFARYYYNENLFISLMAPLSVDDLDFSDDGEGGELSQMDFARIGAGYSFNVWNNINVEPSYSMYIKEFENFSTGETSRRGKFNIGITATF